VVVEKNAEQVGVWKGLRRRCLRVLALSMTSEIVEKAWESMRKILLLVVLLIWMGVGLSKKRRRLNEVVRVEI
jgi:hypothetical protein